MFHGAPTGSFYSVFDLVAVALQVIKKMISRGIIREDACTPSEQTVTSTSRLSYGFNPQQELLAFLLCHFLWPFVDSLWALTNALFTMQDQHLKSSSGKGSK